METRDIILYFCAMLDISINTYGIIIDGIILCLLFSSYFIFRGIKNGKRNWRKCNEAETAGVAKCACSSSE